MASMLRKFRNKIKSEFSAAASATWKYVKIGTSRVGRMNTNTSLNKTYRELGIETNRQMNDDTDKDIRKNSKVINLMNKIKVFKQDIVDSKLKVKNIRKGSVSQAKIDEKRNKPTDAGKKKSKIRT